MGSRLYSELDSRSGNTGHNSGRDSSFTAVDVDILSASLPVSLTVSCAWCGKFLVLAFFCVFSLVAFGVAGDPATPSRQARIGWDGTGGDETGWDGWNVLGHRDLVLIYSTRLMIRGDNHPKSSGRDVVG